MSVKTPINTVIHVIFCTAIALLLAFIVRENAMDYDDDIQVLARKTAQNGQSVIAASNKELLRACIKQTKDYPSAMAKEYRALTQVIKLKSDSIQYLIDSLSKSEDVILLSTIQGMLHQQRSLIIKMIDFDKYVEAFLPRFLPADWLCQSWKDDTKEQYKTVLEQAKTNCLFMERVALFYFESKIMGHGCGFDKFWPIFNSNSPSPIVGDTLSADILLGSFGQGHYDYQFTVNGNQLSGQLFRQRLKKVGIYPLQIKVESKYGEHDSIVVAEKTYYITVRK
jgi:hypothetical protein